MNVVMRIYHAPRLDNLATLFAQNLLDNPPGVFEMETVATPGNGVHRWLDQVVSLNGIAAGIAYHHPRHVAQLFLPHDPDPWAPSALVWHILTLMQNHPERAWIPTLEFEPNTRYGPAQKVAQLFDHYARQRPSMLQAWIEGQMSDGHGALPPEHVWQHELFRSLVGHIGELPAPLREVNTEKIATRRVHLFGYPHLFPGDVLALKRVSPKVEATVWLVHEPTYDDDGTIEWLATCFPQAKITSVGEGIDHAPLSIHACAGPTRQVEVAREELTHLFATTPDLQPREVVVLTPDPGTYGPLFSAHFASATAHPAGKVPLVAAGMARVNPLVELAGVLVGFVHDRIRATDVIELVNREEVQNRFAFTQSDVEMLGLWVKSSGIRWGFGQQDRARFGVPTAQNTIDFGLDRLLLGALHHGGEPVAGVVAYEGISSTDIDLLGRFTEFLTRLDHGIHTLAQAETLCEWVEALTAVITSISVGQEWEEADFHATLAPLVEHEDIGVEVQDVHTFFRQATHPHATGVNYRNGALTVAPMGALQGVGHKVVCLVGMDDGAFPHDDGFGGEDILKRNPQQGEKDQGSQQRQSFYHALTAATQQVIMTYTGIDPDHGQEEYPATLVAEILDNPPAPIQQPSLVTHPLHPFDSAYFTPGTELITYDSRHYQAGGLQGVPVVGVSPLPQVETTTQEDIQLEDLHRFFANPVRFFYRDVMGVSLPEVGDPPPTLIPTTVTGLDRWKVGTRAIEVSARLGWVEPTFDQEHYLGEVPPGALGKAQVAQINTMASNVIEQARHVAVGTPEEYDVDIPIAGVRVSGRIRNVYANTVVRITFSSPSPIRAFRAWLDLLVLSLAYPNQPWRAVVITRDTDQAHTTTLTAPSAADSHAYIADLVDVFQRGNQQPLPLPPNTAAGWAKVAHQHPHPLTREQRARAMAEAGKYWTTHTQHAPKEDQDPYNAWMWQGVVDLSTVINIEATTGERWLDEPSRFAQLAMRMWEGFYAHQS